MVLMLNVNYWCDNGNWSTLSKKVFTVVLRQFKGEGGVYKGYKGEQSISPGFLDILNISTLL